MRCSPRRLLKGVGSRWRRFWYARQIVVGARPSFGKHLLIHVGNRITVGDDFSCWRFCTLAACEDGRIEIGHRVALNANVYLNACSGGTIRIGNDVLIGPNVVMRSSDHAFDDPDIVIRLQRHIPGTITIEDDVWIGANVTVVGGVTIARGAVVAAGAVVTRDVEPGVVVAGVPAKMIKRRGQA